MNIEQTVREIVARQMKVPIEAVSIDKAFVADLGADSLDTVELVMGFEDAFGIEIPDHDAETITTVQSAIDYVVAHAQLA